MQVTTRGIVFHTVPYSDSSVITKIFTRKTGLTSYIIKGIRSKKGNKTAVLQPLSIVEIEAAQQEKRNIHFLKQIKLLNPYQEIPFNPVKSCLMLFINEMLVRSIEENHRDEELFDFLENSFLMLDKMKNPRNFHLVFLLKLTQFLGISPNKNEIEDLPYFDLLEGQFTAAIPKHRHFIENRITSSWAECMVKPMNQSGEILLSRAMRQNLLDAIVEYYQLHLSSMGNIKSLEVLKNLFSD